MNKKMIILAILFCSKSGQLNASEGKELSISRLSAQIVQLNKTMLEGFSLINFRLTDCEKRLQILEKVAAPLRQMNLTCYCNQKDIDFEGVQELVYHPETGTYRTKN